MTPSPSVGHWKPVVDMQVLEEGMLDTVCPSPGTRPLLSNGWSGAGGVPQGHLHLGEGQALPSAGSWAGWATPQPLFKRFFVCLFFLTSLLEYNCFTMVFFWFFYTQMRISSEEF